MSEEKEKSIWDQFPSNQLDLATIQNQYSSAEKTAESARKGFFDVPRVFGLDAPQALYETFITTPYGYKMGDYNIKTDDPNHKEYKQAFDFFEKYKKEVNPFLTGDKATELLQSQGFINTKFGPNGVYTQRSKAEQDRITNESVVSSFIEEQRSFYNKFYNLDEEELETKWIDQLVRTIPTFATQVLASVYNPIAGMSYASSLMYADTYQTAKQYDVSPQEAGRLASIVSLVSFATNYGPSTLYNSAVKNNPKLFRDVLFNKSFKKNLHKDVPVQAFKGGLFESIQESIDEITSITAEGTYRDISDDEWWERIKTSASIGFVLGGTASSTLTRINNEKNKPILKKITDAENLQLPYFMEVNKNGDVNFNVKKEDFKDIEMYERVKKLTDSQEFRDKVDPYIIAEKNRKIETDTGVEIPMNVMIFNELNTNNPNTDDVDIEFNKDIPISIMTDKQLQEKNYDTEDFKISEIKEGEEAYEEGKRKFKVKVLGSNIYSSTGGSVILSKGTNQDVYIEEIVEVLYKKLSQTNPELKSKIDNWIGGMEGILNDNGVGGPRGIELFSKWYTFNYLGYGNTETAIKDVISIPTEITQEFDKIMGEQKDGTNVAFLFKGGDPIITDPVEDTEVAETTEDVDTPEQSFRLSPSKFSDIEIKIIKEKIEKGFVPFNTELENYFVKSWIGNVNVTNELERLHNLYLRSQNKNLVEDQKELLERVNSLRTRLNLSDPLGYNDVDVTTISDELGLTLDDALDKGIITEEERTNLANFVSGKPIPKKLETINPPENIDEILINLKDKYSNKVVEGLKSWEQSPEQSFRLAPQKLAKIEDFLMEVAMEGEFARFWYEKSGQALLDIVDGDYDKARKLLSIIAITSPQMDVKSNFGQMVKANYKYVQGMEPEAGRFPKAMSKRIKDVMEGKDFGGIKTNSFLDNLLVQLEEYQRAVDPVTVDLWMMRAFGFDKDVPTDLEYKQIRDAVQKIATRLGWKPHQVQASIWTSVQARWNLIYNQEKEKSIKAGTLKKVGRKYVWRSKKSEQNFRKRIFKLLKTTSLPQKAIEDNNFDYSDALNTFKGVISTETFPHPTTEVFKGLNPSFEQQLDYDYDIRELLTDDNGKDKIAKLIGLLEVGKFNAPGFYEGNISPSQQLEVLMSTTETSINPETKSLLELYASIYGILTKQQAVGVTKVFAPKSKKKANVVMVETKNDIFFEQIYSELFNKGYDTGAIPQNYGFNIVNFDPSVDNNIFYNDVKEILNNIYDNSEESLIFERGQSDGLYIDNNWKENPNGENYRKRISESKQQDVIEQFINSTSNEISKINSKYQKEWSEESFRLAPQDPDELTSDAIVELENQEKLQTIYSTPPKESKFSINKLFNTDIKVGRGLEKALTPISSVLEKINPSLKRKLRDFEFRILTKTRDRRLVVKNFYDKAKSMTQQDYYILDLAFKNADGGKITELIDKYNLNTEYQALRDMLDTIRQEYIDSGGEVGLIDNFIPRLVKDIDGLRENIFGIDPKAQTLYNKLVNKAVKEKGSELDSAEKEQIINMIMRGYKTLNEGKPRSAKPRVVKLVDNDMNEYYAHSTEALMSHVEQMTDVIEKRNLLGKNDLTEDSIAKYIRESNEQSPLTQEQETTLKQILNARINPAMTSKLVGGIKNSTYILTMGNPLSAITQLGDLVWSYDQAGVFGTLKSLVGKKKIKVKDLGIEKIGQEFTSTTPLASAVATIFKIVGIAKIDRLGKETLINSVYNKYVKEAKKGKLSSQFEKDLDSYFDSKDVNKRNKLIDDLKNEKVTEDVQILVFNKLLDHQPVTQSEMPQSYLEANGGRLLYQLKTFTLKQLDVTRRKITNDVIKAKNKKERIRGLGNLLRFLALWVFAGATKDIIKDLILGRPVDKKISFGNDYIVENLLQFAGANRYQIYQAKRFGLKGIIMRFAGPPSASIAEEFATDVYKVVTDKKLTKAQEKMTAEEIEELRGDEVKEDVVNLLQRVPVVGKIAFWRSSFGRNRILKQKLRELKDDLNENKTLSSQEILQYEDFLDEALELDMITQKLYDKRTKQLYE